MNKKLALTTALCLSLPLFSACTNHTATINAETAYPVKPQATSPMKPHHSNQHLLGAWHVETINSKPVIDRSPARFVFSDKQQISGSASCNNFSSQYVLKDKLITINPAAMTRKMCLPALMNQENNFVAALAKVRQYKIEQNMLYLVDDKENVIFKAARIMKK